MKRAGLAAQGREDDQTSHGRLPIALVPGGGGRFPVVDRNVIGFGDNACPREIAEVLHEDPDVREAALTGSPDDVLGDEVVAAVALTAGETCGRELRPPRRAGPTGGTR
jgi:acyl-CoA synthetase (AMP-forming)/AMP-acid ligase II